MEEFVKIRNEALLSLDKEKIIALLKLVAQEAGDLCRIAEDENVFWAGVHKARLGVTAFSEEVKQESKDWLAEHGFSGLVPEWVVHVIGPDEIHNMPDELTALREANKLNKGAVKFRNDDPSPNNPFVVALVKDASVEGC